MERYSIILKGIVQGGGCRYYCAKACGKAGIHGSASNLRDGNVKLIIAVESEKHAFACAEMLKNNSFSVPFYGSIESYDCRKTDEPIEGNIVW